MSAVRTKEFPVSFFSFFFSQRASVAVVSDIMRYPIQCPCADDAKKKKKTSNTKRKKKRIFRWPTRPEEGVRLRGTQSLSRRRRRRSRCSRLQSAKVRVTTRREHDFVISRHPEWRGGASSARRAHNAKTLEKLLLLLHIYSIVWPCVNVLTARLTPRMFVRSNILVTYSYIYKLRTDTRNKGKKKDRT